MAASYIDEYFWNLKEYEEWDQRYIAETEKELLKQRDFKTQHELAARNAWRSLAGLWGRKVIVDGTVYYIKKDDDDWKKLIIEEKQEVA